MSRDLQTALVELEKELRKLGRREAVVALRPGLTSDATKAALDEIALPASPDVLTLYAWHDGTQTAESAPTDDVEIFPGFYFATLDEAVVNYRAFLQSDRWETGWLPVLANGGGDFYVVDLNHQSVVRHFRIDESEHPVEYNSLADFIQTVVEGARRGLVFVDQDGYLAMDYPHYGDLAGELNPSVAWWRS